MMHLNLLRLIAALKDKFDEAKNKVGALDILNEQVGSGLERISVALDNLPAGKLILDDWTEGPIRRVWIGIWSLS